MVRSNRDRLYHQDKTQIPFPIQEILLPGGGEASY